MSREQYQQHQGYADQVYRMKSGHYRLNLRGGDKLLGFIVGIGFACAAAVYLK